MGSLINNKSFRENLLRQYLGKHENRFHQEKPEIGLELTTKSIPRLVISLIVGAQVYVTLYEHTIIDEDDVYHEYYEYYSRMIMTVAAEDPKGIEKIEEAVTSALIG